MDVGKLRAFSNLGVNRGAFQSTEQVEKYNSILKEVEKVYTHVKREAGEEEECPPPKKVLKETGMKVTMLCNTLLSGGAIRSVQECEELIKTHNDLLKAT
jgi:hypothetical protein